MSDRYKPYVLKYDILQENLSSGQALLIVVLVIVVALTVGLSVAVRTTTNLRISSENESSEKAFSAAEAGIEQALVNNSSIPSTLIGTNASYETDVAVLSGQSIILNNDSLVLKDEPVDLWLSTYPTYSSSWSGNLTINWGALSDSCNASESLNTKSALEVIVISGTVANPITTTYLIDPCSARSSSNNFEFISVAGNTINGRTFANKKSITINSGLIVRIIPLYAGSIIAVEKGSADPNIPGQGIVITSTGQSGDTVRKIVTYRSYPKLPIELFPFVYFGPK